MRRLASVTVVMIAVFGGIQVIKSLAVEQPHATEPVKTHLGGCILLAPAGEVPGDLYQETKVVATDEYQPFTKKLMVYGITLIGRDDISDDFMRQVAKTIKEVFPQGEGIDSDLQKEVLRNLYRYRVAIPLFRGEAGFDSEEDWATYRKMKHRNSVCDIIMEGVDGQVMEVVEHILHFVSDIGLHYTFPKEWGISTRSQLYQAMQESIEKGYYDVTQYGDIESEEGNRVLLQEFAYWIITSAWNLQKPYGPTDGAEWKVIRTAADLKSRLPLSYRLIQQTISKVMVSPSRVTLDAFNKKSGVGKESQQ